MLQPSGSARVRTTAMVCGWQSASTKKALRSAARSTRHGHRFGRGGAFVEQRRIGDLEPGEIGDHGLEIQQGFQPALADLGLIWRVGRVPGRILQDVALDHRRQDRAVIALPDQRCADLILARDLAQFVERLRFRQGRPPILSGFALADVRRNGLRDRFVEIGRRRRSRSIAPRRRARRRYAGREIVRIGRRRWHHWFLHGILRFLRGRCSADQGLVASFVHQCVDLRRIRDLQLDEPAFGHRIGIDQARDRRRSLRLTAITSPAIGA